MYQSILVVFLVVLAGCSQLQPPTEPEIVETTGDADRTGQAVPTVQNEPFNIDFDFTTTLHDSVWLSVLTAGYIWEQIIVEGLPDVNDPSLGHVDDLLVSIKMATTNKPHDIDGFNTLASARPIHSRSDTLGLPYYGEITIYPVLADTLYTVLEKSYTIMHELCHVLGFTDRYLDRVGTETILGVRYFNGARAAEGYKVILYYGLEEKLSYAIPGLRVPLMNDSPHWRWPALNWELMSPLSRTLQERRYFTLVTMLAMADLGYTVDTSLNEMPPFNNAATKPTINRPFICDGEHIRVAHMH